MVSFDIWFLLEMNSSTANICVDNFINPLFYLLQKLDGVLLIYISVYHFSSCVQNFFSYICEEVSGDT